MKKKNMKHQRQNYTRKELIRAFHQQTLLPWIKCVDIIEELLTLLKEGLQKGQAIKLTRFGTFQTSKVKARQGRHFATGETILIPSRPTVRFRPSLALKKNLNKSTVSNTMS